jgi:hypothetical protein
MLLEHAREQHAALGRRHLCDVERVERDGVDLDRLPGASAAATAEGARTVNAVTRLLKPLDEWTTDDVRALVSERVEEGQRLEYKRELKLGSRTEKAEAAKDVSGMANATGGLLVYGVGEEQLEDGRRLPTRLSPLADGNAQAQLEDVLHSAVSPSLNMTSRLLEAPEGGFFLLVRVQQRSGPLHMVEGYKENRYYLRSGLSTKPMESHEVERAFRELSATENKVVELVSSAALIPRIARGRFRAGDMITNAEPKMQTWTSLVTAPLDAPGQLLPMRTPDPLDFDTTPARPKMIGDFRAVHPGSFGVDAGGYVHESVDEHGYTHDRLRLYRSGVFEWGARYSGDNYQNLPTALLVEETHDVLAYFATVYERVNYYGRVRVWVRVDNADHAELMIDPQFTSMVRGQQTPTVEVLEYVTDTNVEALSTDAMPIVHAAMDRIWQGFGLPRALLFSPEGEYLKRRR